MLRERKIKEVIILGAGYYGIMAIYFCKKKQIKVISCMDNNVNRQGKVLFDDVPCKKPYFEKDIPVIISIKDDELAKELLEQCKKLGYTDIVRVDHDKLENEYHKLPDKEYCELQYALCINGKTIDWNNPITFNEKIQWLKLHDRRPEYTKLVDKYEVKKSVAEKIGMEYIIPTLGVWNNFDDINFDELPEKFVLKCTHDSGGVIICTDKTHFDKQNVKEKLQNSLRRNYYYVGREWPYKNVEPRIIAEQYLEDKEGKEIIDYKLMCFNGSVECSFVCSNRRGNGGLCVNFYDKEWNAMPFCRHYPKREMEFDKPKLYDRMVEIAEILSKHIPFVRVDLYICNQQIYFGEMTFYPGNGVEEFTPDMWDVKLGEWLKLPENMIHDTDVEA